MRAENDTPDQRKPGASRQSEPDQGNTGLPRQGEPGLPGQGEPRQGKPAQDRPPLDAARLNQAILHSGGLWQAIEVTASTGSTNADLLARAAQGAPEGLVLTAEEQLAGRGRMGRSWVSPPRSALMFSLLLRPQQVPVARRGWLPLLAGVAVAEAVSTVTGIDARLKWPNDLMVRQTQPARDAQPTRDAKLAGILAEASGDAIVVGVGLNVSSTPAELPPPRPGALPATSLRLAAADQVTPDREALLAAILASFERWYGPWRQAAGDAGASGLRPAYTHLCATIGRHVRAELPGDQLLSGLAVGVDSDGRLLVRGPSGAEVRVAAGDVVHLR
jgi:BirA family biotin operon repressor/biotin-[acetyl-CoA-carboxylase] ligase